MADLKAPVRACRLTLDMQADNGQEMVDALSNMADQLERGELTKGVSGGPYSGWTYEFIENEHPTHDEYFVEVRAYLDAKKAADTAGVRVDVCPHCKAEVGEHHNCPVAGPIWTPQELAAAKERAAGLAAWMGVVPGVKGLSNG